MKHYRIFAAILAIALLLTMTAGCSKTPEDNGEENLDYIGSVTDGSYYNPYFDLSFTAPEGWTYYNEEALLSVMGATTETTSENLSEAYAQQLETTGAAYVMLVTGLSGEGANIVVQKTQEEHKDLSDERLYSQITPTVEAQIQQVGLSGAVTVDTTNFLEEERDVLLTTIDAVGVVQKQIYIVKDTYTCIVTASAFDEATTDAIMAMFAR